jgi:hypothetical protein
MFYNSVCFLRDVCKDNNLVNNDLTKLPNTILEYIEIFNGENLRKEFILNNFKYFWKRYILEKMLSEKSLNLIITSKINKCLCQYFINKSTKVYHYKARYIQLFSSYPLNENIDESYLDELLIKFYNKNKVYYYNITLILNLKKFIIKNEQTVLDKNLQIEFINILKQKLVNNINSIYYKQDLIYQNRMKLVINIESNNYINERDIIKYKILLEDNEFNNKVDIMKEFLRDKFRQHLLF